jgi:hypothetical protein
LNFSWTCITDGNALFHSVVRLPNTFGEFAKVIFQCLPMATVVHFVTDTYKADSIKNIERARRGDAPTFQIGGSMTVMPKEFTKFLSNAANKKQLIKLILNEWKTDKYAPYLVNRSIYYVIEEDCFCLQSIDGRSVSCLPVNELKSSHEEADTRIVLHVIYASRHMSAEDKIVVQSPDTDVFIILLAHASRISQHVLFDTGKGTNKRRIDVKGCIQVIGQDTALALPGFHAFTGCDCTSAFATKGKKGPYNVLIRNNGKDFIHVFRVMGSSANCLTPAIYLKLEQFVCCMYGQSKCLDVNRARSQIFQSRYGGKLSQLTSTGKSKGIDLSLLPPCKSALYKHCQHANYQAFIWNNAHIANPEIPSPLVHGWTKNADGLLTVEWIEGDLMPMAITEILADEGSSTEKEEVADEDVIEEDDEIDNIIDIVFDEDTPD